MLADGLALLGHIKDQSKVLFIWNLQLKGQIKSMWPSDAIDLVNIIPCNALLPDGTKPLP